MKIETREVDRERGIVRITTEDQRFYSRKAKDSAGETVWDFVPSVTWICGFYYKNERFIRYVGRVGNEGAEEAKVAGGEKGSKVHQAIGVIIEGGKVNIETSLFPNRDGKPEPLNAEEIECVLSFIEWFKKHKPKVIATEFTVWSDKYRYAGTVDLYCTINGIPWIVDFKVSANVYVSHEIQVSAYKFAEPGRFAPNTRLAILQLNYKLNKKQKWKFTRVKDQFTLFMSTRRVWAKETEGIKPFQKDYPLELSL
jgi:hypothetical protein